MQFQVNRTLPPHDKTADRGDDKRAHHHVVIHVRSRAFEDITHVFAEEVPQFDPHVLQMKKTINPFSKWWLFIGDEYPMGLNLLSILCDLFWSVYRWSFQSFLGMWVVIRTQRLLVFPPQPSNQKGPRLEWMNLAHHGFGSNDWCFNDLRGFFVAYGQLPLHLEWPDSSLPLAPISRQRGGYQWCDFFREMCGEQKLGGRHYKDLCHNTMVLNQPSHCYSHQLCVGEHALQSNISLQVANPH